ncbi:MAG: NigD-like C-terminal domain-containing protein [Alloprevotella sp.]
MTKSHRLFRSLSLLAGFVLVSVGLFFHSCSDAEDGAVLPPARFDLGEVATGAKGQVSEIRFDNGQTLAPANTLPRLRPDTLYRMLVGYQITTDTKAAVHQWMPVLTIHARHFSAEEMRTDPVKVISVWQTSRYINLRIAVPRTAAKKHYFSFQTAAFQQPTDEQKPRRLVLHLYHDAAGDRPDYWEEMYLSCPIYGYTHKLRTGLDSITMVVSTPSGEQQHSARFR